VALATHRLRIGTYVLANDYRNPVLLAKDAASLDIISGGRFELGIGAGRPAAEMDNRMMGLPFESGARRVERLAEALGIIRPLLRGERLTLAGRHYAVEDATVSPPPLQQPLPIMVAAGRPRLLDLAARQAEIIALGLPPAASEAEVMGIVTRIRAAAGERFSAIELNINLAAVGGEVPRFIQMTMGPGAAALAGSDAVSVLKGSTDAMCERLLGLRERLGISYIAVGDELMERLAPVVARLSGE
jgi:probable F420-dependent oxidoreductase